MSHMKYLAEKLSLDIKSIIIWFHNTRTRNKRRCLSFKSSSTTDEPMSYFTPNHSFNSSITDPIDTIATPANEATITTTTTSTRKHTLT